jgi:hypothetical protein
MIPLGCPTILLVIDWSHHWPSWLDELNYHPLIPVPAGMGIFQGIATA